MTLERATMAFAGFMVFLSVVLTYLVHPYFVALTVYVALNLFQSAFTGYCPAATMLLLVAKASGTSVVLKEKQRKHR